MSRNVCEAAIKNGLLKMCRFAEASCYACEKHGEGLLNSRHYFYITKRDGSILEKLCAYVTCSHWTWRLTVPAPKNSTWISLFSSATTAPSPPSLGASIRQPSPSSRGDRSCGTLRYLVLVEVGEIKRMFASAASTRFKQYPCPSAGSYHVVLAAGRNLWFFFNVALLYLNYQK